MRRKTTLLVVENGALGVNKEQDPSSNLSFRNYFKISPNKVSGFSHLIPNQFAGSCFYLDHFTNGNLRQYIDLCNRDANKQCSLHIGTSQLICRANQLTGFYMMGTLVVKGLTQFSRKCGHFDSTFTKDLVIFKSPTLREKCPNTGKYGPEITPYLDTFHPVQRHYRKTS